MIKKTVLICFIYFCLNDIANAIETGLYLSPKFIFSSSILKVDNNNVNNLYIGAGASIGYNFYALHQYTPIRIEFEYLYRGGLNRNSYSVGIDSMKMHTFLFSAYYDVNFLRVDYNPVVESKVYTGGKRYLMNFYVGILFGAGMERYITDTITEKIGMITIANYYNESKFIYGVGLGFAINITTLITFDVGYRLLLDTKFAIKNDMIIALRLNF